MMKGFTPSVAAGVLSHQIAAFLLTLVSFVVDLVVAAVAISFTIAAGVVLGVLLPSSDPLSLSIVAIVGAIVCAGMLFVLAVGCVPETGRTSAYMVLSKTQMRSSFSMARAAVGLLALIGAPTRASPSSAWAA